MGTLCFIRIRMKHEGATEVHSTTQAGQPTYRALRINMVLLQLQCTNLGRSLSSPSLPPQAANYSGEEAGQGVSAQLSGQLPGEVRKGWPAPVWISVLALEKDPSSAQSHQEPVSEPASLPGVGCVCRNCINYWNFLQSHILSLAVLAERDLSGLV